MKTKDPCSRNLNIMSSIYLYAELLINIRQVTVFVLLPSDSNERTQIRLLSNLEAVIVRHDGQEASVSLPCQIINSTTLKMPTAPTKEFSFRLGISSAVDLPATARSVAHADAPWPASKLSSETWIACRSCGNPLVKDLMVWKDLPSSGWADMMDFWHCHKPPSQNLTSDDHLSMKGYAAGNDLGPAAGVGLVDISHFLLAERDCNGVQVRCEFSVNSPTQKFPFRKGLG